MPRTYSLEELETLTKQLLREEPELAKASIIQSIAAFGLASGRDQILLAEDIYAEVASRKFDIAYGRMHEYNGKQALECYLPYDEGRGELLIYTVAVAATGYAELFSAKTPETKKIA